MDIQVQKKGWKFLKKNGYVRRRFLAFHYQWWSVIIIDTFYGSNLEDMVTQQNEGMNNRLNSVMPGKLTHIQGWLLEKLFNYGWQTNTAWRWAGACWY